MIMKRQLFAFLLVWICSGVTMHAYQADNKILGLSFTFLSSMYFFILKERSNKSKKQRKYIKARKNNIMAQLSRQKFDVFIMN